MNRLGQTRAFFLLLAILPLTGCLFRSRKVERQLRPVPLQTATQEQLVEAINVQAARIRTLQATVDIDTSVGGAKKGTITDYKEIRGYVLARKPAMLRLIGLLPIVRNKGFDMVSDGRQFKLWIPPKNRFVLGRNDVEVADPKQALENIRPQNFYEALLIREIDPVKEIAVLENGVETVLDARRHLVDQPDYEILAVRRGKAGWFLSRKIVFSRTDLQPHRQIIYDKNGYIASDVKYDNFAEYDGVSLPSNIHIWRPEEEYSIDLHMVKVQINQPLTDEQFVLNQPPGSQLIQLGAQNGHATTQVPANAAQPQNRSQ